MKLVTFDAGDGARVGALLGDDAVLDLTVAQASANGVFASMQRLIEAGAEGLEEARSLIEARASEAVIDRAAVRLLAPLPVPVRLRDCSLFTQHFEAGLAKHAREKAALADDPEAEFERLMADEFAFKPIMKREILYYNSDHLAVSGPDDDIVWPSDSDWMDYELEWACVVGKSGRDIQRDLAREHIFGFTVFNDWSARDTQFAVMETKLGPGRGKDFANSNGLGPCIATVDEFEDPYALEMRASVNGELWSSGNTGSMHHLFEDAIVQFSRERMLHAGEVIGSGTVLNGCAFELGRKLSSGDVVELEIKGIGTLRNQVLSAR